MFDPWRSAGVYVDALAVARAPPVLWRRRQVDRLQALLRAAAQGSRWWRDRLPALPSDETQSLAALLQAIPVSRKPDLMRRFDQWLTVPDIDLPALRAFAADPTQQGRSYRGRYLVWESSGSSGEPALFVQDEAALAVSDALEAARGPASLPGPWAAPAPGQLVPRLAFVGAIDGPFASIVSLQRLRRLNPWLAAATDVLSFLRPIADLVDELNELRPGIVASYPSMAWVLAREQSDGRLRIEPEAVWMGGETLTPATRRAIGHAFRCPVRNSYGASECLTIANDCRCGALHLNADWVILEPVDERMRPVKDGEFGQTTLLTQLANQVQPIIRYELDDRVRFAPIACACGSPLPVIEVEGRSDEVLTLEDLRGRSVHLSPLALTTVLEEEGGAFDFRLVQTGPRRLRLDLFGRLRLDRVASDRAAATLREYLRRQGLAGIEVRSRRAQCPERGRSGKLQRVACAHEA